jgi:hypothetical protein
MDTIRIIRMRVHHTVITAQSGFRAASLLVRARGIADGDIRIGIVDSIAPVSTAADITDVASRDGALKVAALKAVDLTDTGALKVVMASAAANRTVEADSTVADHVAADAGNRFRLGR